MIKKTGLLSPLVLLLLFSIAFVACKKKDSNVGLSAQPEEDLMYAIYSDTCSITSYVTLEDSMRTDESYTGSIKLVGSYIDSVFGRTDASIYTNFYLQNGSVNFGANPIIDSLVVRIKYDSSFAGTRLQSFYADKNSSLKFNVYQLQDSLLKTNDYYSYQQTNYLPGDITYTGDGITLTPNLTSRELRLKLKNEIGQDFLNNPGYFANNTTFQSAFKGIFITTQHTSNLTTGHILSLNLNNDSTKMTIYYHSGTEHFRYDIKIGANAAYYNLFSHDYSMAHDSIKYQLPPHNDIKMGEKELFLQGMAGIKASIKMPFLEKLSDSIGPVAINKAELTFKANNMVPYVNRSAYEISPYLTLNGVESSKAVALKLDDDYIALLDESNGEYTFAIRNTVQQIVLKNVKDYSFQLRVRSEASNPTRIVLGGGKNNTFPIKLKLWYTRL